MQHGLFRYAAVYLIFYSFCVIKMIIDVTGRFMILKNVTFTLMVFLLSLSACSGNDEIKTIRSRGQLRVGVKADVPRFGYLNLNNDELEGMEIDLGHVIAKDILNDENAVKFIVVGGAQTRAAMLENGEIDIAIATFSITEERKKAFNFSRSYYT